MNVQGKEGRIFNSSLVLIHFYFPISIFYLSLTSRVNQFWINIINKSILDSGESIDNLMDEAISIYEDFMIHLSETLPLTTISIEENYRNINIYRAGRGRSELETYFAIFCWQWRCYLCRAGHVSISRGEVSAYLQSVCIQIGFKSQPSVYCDAATLGELASVAGDGWSWIKAICELDQSLLKSPTWIGLKIPVSCHIRSSKWLCNM